MALQFIDNILYYKYVKIKDRIKMFNWFKKHKINKEIKQNLSELKQMIMNIQITKSASGKELEEFYTQVDVWDKVLSEKRVEFYTVMSQLTVDDKMELLKHLDECINIYGSRMIVLNEALIGYLENDKLSPTTKAEIAHFGSENVIKSDKTITVLRDIAKYIALSK